MLVSGTNSPLATDNICSIVEFIVLLIPPNKNNTEIAAIIKTDLIKNLLLRAIGLIIYLFEGH